MKFGTYNMAGAAPGYHGRGLKGITQWIKDNDIDICALQEVDRFSKMSGYEDFPAYMEKETGFHAYFMPASIEKPHEPGKPPREYGNCILSRYPLKETHSFFLTGPDKPTVAAPPDEAPWGDDTRIALLVKVEIENRDVWVLGTHLTYTPDYRPSPIVEFQIKNLLTHIDKIVPKDAPLILGGDLNNLATAPDFSPLRKAFTCATTHIAPTWPVDYRRSGTQQTHALDHIFLRGASASDVKVHVDEQLSDHAGVCATITLKPVAPAPAPK